MKGITIKVSEDEIGRIELLRDNLVLDTGVRISRHAVIKKMLRDGYNLIAGEMSKQRIELWEKPV